MRHTLRSFGVPLDGPAWLFGDNQSVVTSSTVPHSTLSKRWNALSCHRVREAAAAGWLRFEHIPGAENPADIFTEPLPWFTMKTFVEPILVWKGETADPPGNDNPEGSITAHDDAAVVGPGLDTTRDLVGHNASTVVVTDLGVTIETPSGAGVHVPWNNMCVPLYDEGG